MTYCISYSYVVGLDDVEKDLANIDKDEKLQDSELMDMDADISLPRAVVEKDRKNDSFKVKSPKCSNFENMQIAQHPRFRLKLVNAVFKQFCPLFVYYIHHDKFSYRVLKLLDNFWPDFNLVDYIRLENHVGARHCHVHEEGIDVWERT
mgnify:CR=1 FL=1